MFRDVLNIKDSLVVFPNHPVLVPVESVVKHPVLAIALHVALLSCKHRRHSSCLSFCSDSLITALQERKGLLSRLTLLLFSSPRRKSRQQVSWSHRAHSEQAESVECRFSAPFLLYTVQNCSLWNGGTHCYSGLPAPRDSPPK